MKRLLIAGVLLLAACGSDPGTEAAPTEVILLTHDSFAMDSAVIEEFEQQAGLTVKIVQNGDAGQLVNSAILAAGNPQGDVLFGVDNTFLSRAQQAGVFSDYQAAWQPGGIRPARRDPDRHRRRLPELRHGLLRGQDRAGRSG
ncbi:MAG: extracellular solute-binding protein [Candidatus Nanopelagicales bacterium]